MAILSAIFVAHNRPNQPVAGTNGVKHVHGQNQFSNCVNFGGLVCFRVQPVRRRTQPEYANSTAGAAIGTFRGYPNDPTGPDHQRGSRFAGTG